MRNVWLAPQAGLAGGPRRRAVGDAQRRPRRPCAGPRRAPGGRARGDDLVLQAWRRDEPPCGTGSRSAAPAALMACGATWPAWAWARAARALRGAADGLGGPGAQRRGQRQPGPGLHQGRRLHGLGRHASSSSSSPPCRLRAVDEGLAAGGLERGRVCASTFRYSRSAAISATNRSSTYRPWPPNMRCARTAPSGASSSRQWSTSVGWACVRRVVGCRHNARCQRRCCP